MKRVLIANRGEVALRVVRACRRAGLETVAVHSAADAASPHVFAADEAVEIGPPAPGQSYLNQAILLDVAERTGADAVHPGYGFLSENAGFARKVADRGLTFIGPAPEVIDRMGDKARARQAAMELGVPVVPGSEGVFEDAAAAAAEAAAIGFPLLLKARAGGGGRGMRVAETPEALPGLFQQAHAEAEGAFGDGAIYMERYFSRVRHVEVQVFGDSHGAAAHAWERDCSVQRRHQKLVEEGPSPALSPETRADLCEAAVRLTKGVGYVNAGTVEFLYEPDTDKFFFIEMNTRIQVEHPVSEMITGLDLVQEQLRVADGQRLSFADGPPAIQGAAIEFRVNAEDPGAGFRPSPGRLTAWRPPKGPGLRCDGAVYPDGQISPFYDSMMAKLIVHGADRQDVLARSADALDAFEVEGVATTIPLFHAMLRDDDFRRGAVDTRWMEREFLPGLLGNAG